MGRAAGTIRPVWAAIAIVVAALVAGGGLSAVVAAAPLAVPVGSPVVAGSKATVTKTGGDPIRIRRGPGTAFAQLAFAYEGQIVDVVDGPSGDAQGNRWFRVSAPAGVGWMSGEFLKGAGAALVGSALVANTDGDPLRLRDAPSTDGKVLTLIGPGTVVALQLGPVTDADGIVWYKLTAKSVTGWAMGRYLAQVTATAAARVSSPNAPPKATAMPAKSTPTAAPPARKSTPTPAPAAGKSTPVPTPRATPKPAAAPVRPTRTVAPPANATNALGQYWQWIAEARSLYPYNESANKMWAVMLCESGGNAGASGSGGRYLGLFQYSPATWAGSWNPYRGSSIWDPKSQIFATARAWSIGMQAAWTCYFR